jgi:hypothetical protein
MCEHITHTTNLNTRFVIAYMFTDAKKSEACGTEPGTPTLQVYNLIVSGTVSLK